MNRIYITIATIIFFAIAPLQLIYAQNPLQQSSSYKANLQLEGKISLDSLTRYVHIHTGIRFSFNSGKVNGNKEIFFPKGEYSFTQLLEHIKKTTSLYCTLFNGYVIFQDNPPPKNKDSSSPNNNLKIKNPAQQTNYKVHAHKIMQSAKSNTKKKESTEPLLTSSTTKAEKGTIKQNYERINSSIKHNSDSIINNRITNVKDSIFSKQHLPDKADSIKASTRLSNPIKLKLYSQLGFYASEVLYSNLEYEVGISPLHLLFSAGTDFKITDWQVGFGSIIKSNDKWEWQLNASVGFLKRNLSVDSSIVSGLVTIKGNLYAGNISMNKKLSSKWLIKISTSFNVLKTVYYLNSVVTPVDSLPRQVSGSENEIKLLNNPLLLRNTFDVTKSSNSKEWIGISIGIYYNLF